ncbi:MAG: hypothetical protein QNJ41_22575, partial [Xenococcaceae cyanobacterium MO_188.B32]|nr:hypothetical protein [Xenococcaceae cyanobacterium MO_188.B32]
MTSAFPCACRRRGVARLFAPQKIYFIFRQKQGTNFKKQKGEEQKLSTIEMAPGCKVFLSNIYITKNKGFGYFNLAAYWKRKYKNKLEKEPWYLLTNLDNLDDVIRIYRSPMGGKG